MRIVSIQKVSKKEIREFHCGIEELDTFIGKYAMQNDKKDIGKSFVLTDESRIIGFYTLSNAQIAFGELKESLSKGLPKYPVPCIRIARLAVAEEFQKRGYGAILLKDAILRILNVADHTGIYFVIVDAKESFFSFYEKYGFVRLEHDLTYLLPIATIRKAFEKQDDRSQRKRSM